MQLALTPTLWTTPTNDTVSPQFCLAMAVPNESCDKLTMAFSVNPDTLRAIGEATPAKNPASSLVTLAASIADIGLSEISMGISLGGGLELPLKIYDNDNYYDDTFPAHLAFGFQGDLELPFLPESLKKVIGVSGEYKRAWSFGNHISTVESIVDQIFSMDSGLDPAQMLADYFDLTAALPEAIVTSASMSIGLKALTKGLLQDINIAGVEISALMVPNDNFKSFRTGFYFYAKAEVTLMQDICDMLDGVLKLVAGTGCGAIGGTDSAKIGVSIQPDDLELNIKAPELEVTCRVKKIISGHPEMNCKFDDELFSIIEDAAGYVVKKIAKLGGEVIEDVGELAHVSFHFLFVAKAWNILSAISNAFFYVLGHAGYDQSPQWLGQENRSRISQCRKGGHICMESSGTLLHW